MTPLYDKNYQGVASMKSLFVAPQLGNWGVLPGESRDQSLIDTCAAIHWNKASSGRSAYYAFELDLGYGAGLAV